MAHALDTNKILSRYYDGETHQEIAADMGVCPGTIRYRLLKLGIPIRSAAESVQLKNFKTLDAFDAVKRYEDGMSARKIAHQTGMTYDCVKRYLKAKGVTIRTRRQANVCDHQNRNKTEVIDKNIVYYFPTRDVHGNIIKFNRFYGVRCEK